MKNLNSALAPKVILKSISMLMLVCLATLGIGYFVSNPIGGGTSQMPTMVASNCKAVEDIGGRSMEPTLVINGIEIIEEIGGSKPLPSEFDLSLNTIKAIGGKSTTGELNTISKYEIGGNRPVGEIAFYLNDLSDIGGRSSDNGLLNLSFIDLPIGGVKVPSGEFKLST